MTFNKGSLSYEYMMGDIMFYTWNWMHYKVKEDSITHSSNGVILRACV